MMYFLSNAVPVLEVLGAGLTLPCVSLEKSAMVASRRMRRG